MNRAKSWLILSRVSGPSVSLFRNIKVILSGIGRSEAHRTSPEARQFLTYHSAPNVGHVEHQPSLWRKNFGQTSHGAASAANPVHHAVSNYDIVAFSQLEMPQIHEISDARVIHERPQSPNRTFANIDGTDLQAGGLGSEGIKASSASDIRDGSGRRREMGELQHRVSALGVKEIPSSFEHLI